MVKYTHVMWQRVKSLHIITVYTLLPMHYRKAVLPIESELGNSSGRGKSECDGACIDHNTPEDE